MEKKKKKYGHKKANSEIESLTKKLEDDNYQETSNMELKTKTINNL